MPDSDRRVALVTGSSQGIGRAVIERLAEDHSCVVHFRRNSAAAQEVAAALRGRGVQAIAVAADLAAVEEIDELLSEIQSKFGRLDTFVASAASTRFSPVLSLQPRHVDLTMATVVRSFIQLVIGAVNLMRSDGRVIAIGGLDAHFAQAGHGLLGAAKAAVESLVRSLAIELAPRGTTVNMVVPGAIQTNSLDLYFRGNHEAKAEMIRGTPAGRLGSPEDVAELVAFLCSKNAAFVTGQTLYTDGGASAEGGGWSQFRHLWDN